MTADDVHGDDMAHPELSDEQLAALMDGSSDAPVDHPVADAIIRARRELGAEPVPTPGAALSEYLGVGRVTDPMPSSVVDGEIIELADDAEPARMRIPVLASLSAFVGTLTGKILVGTTVAAASLTGAHAAGVVDVPGLPEIDDAAVTETIDDRQDDARQGDTDDSDSSGSGSDDSGSDDDSDSDDDIAVATSTTTTTPATSSSTSSTTSTTTSTSTSTTTSTTVPTSSTTSPPSTSTVPPSSTTTKAYTVAGVGTTTVTVTNLQISLVSAVPAPGWTLYEAGPDEDGVESKYTNGDLETSIDFEIEDGQLRVRVREENEATDERTERFEYFPLS